MALYQDEKVGYLVSGGKDGGVRVWKLTTRELVCEYTDHTRVVKRVLVDVKQPNIVHSVSLDSSVVSFDIKSARKIQNHIINSGSMLDATQRMDSELEVITCDNMGRLLHWDVDIRDPVLAVQDPTRTALNVCQISPSGRYLAFGGDDTLLKVLEVSTGQVLSLGQGHSSPITTLFWTPDERQIISGAADCCLCVWNFFLGGSPN